MGCFSCLYEVIDAEGIGKLIRQIENKKKKKKDEQGRA